MALTGWIPAYYHTYELTNQLFDKLLVGFHTGDCLVTATSKDVKDPDSGIAPEHVYTVLDMQKVNVS